MAKRCNTNPEIVVFAGPNGSGKSTIGEYLRPVFLPYINADEIKRVLGCDDLQAAQLAEQRRENYLRTEQSFCFETVLSTERNLNLLRRAKAAGFFLRCCYVLTVDPQINAVRVMSRVAAGGHDVPVDKIFSRYEKALALVPELIPICDVFHIFDNSCLPYCIFKKQDDLCWYCTEPHLWQKKDIAALTGISNPQRASLNHVT